MTQQKQRVAFVGLGVMGFPMAGHLDEAGHNVTVYNRTPSKVDNWLSKYTGQMANTPAQAAREAQVVFACVGNDDDLRQVVLGEDGAFAGMEHDAVFVDHTTASADIARALSTTARDRGLHFIDAPVSGGESGAQNGTLTVMCGGDEDAFARVESVISCYARAVTLMGPVGAGQLTKMVNQLCIAGLIQSLSEGINFAINAGLDPKRVLAVITKGAAQSWQMENRGESMASGEFDFGFAVDWMRKDLMLCFEEARRNRSRLPVAALVDQFYAQVQARGGGRWDTSSLIHLLRNP